MATEDQILDWVQKNGYPLEMRVVREVRKHSPLYVTQSHHIPDRATGKMREVDAFASWAYVQNDGTHIFTNLAIECKSGPHCWILFRDEDDEFADAPRTVLGLDAIPSALPTRADIDSDATQIFYTEPVPRFLRGRFHPCYAVRQRSAGQDKAQHADPAFSAVKKAVESAYGSLPQQSGHSAQGYIRCVPLIVTSFELFICTLDSESQVHVEITSRASINFTDEAGGRTEVHVVAESELPVFLDEISELAQEFGNHPEFRDHNA